MTKRLRQTLPRLALAAICSAGIGVIGGVDADAESAGRCEAPAGDVVHACYHKEEGTLRLTCGRPCRPSEKPVSWSMTGPAGPAGEDGEDGAMGAPGVSGLERVSFSSSNDSQANKSTFAHCPNFKHVVGGGAQVFIGEQGVVVGPVALKKSLPSDSMDGWAATAEEVIPTDVRWFVTAYALCATTN